MAEQDLASKILDTKVIKGPPTWDGSRRRWRHWSAKLQGFISGVSLPLLELMQLAGRHQHEIKHEGLTEDQKKASGILYSILNSLVEDDAYDTFLASEQGNGFEAVSYTHLRAHET